MKHFLSLVLAICAFPVFAGQTSSNLTNAATVVSNCTITTLNNIQFGTFDALNANATVGAAGNGTVQVKCTKGSYSLIVGNGANWAARLTNSYACTSCQGAGYVTRIFSCDRYMKSPQGGTMGYVIYKDSSLQTNGTNSSGYTYDSDAGTQCKGTPSAFTQMVFDSATRSNNVTLYAQTVSGADNKKVTPGVYTDTLSIQVNF